MFWLFGSRGFLVGADRTLSLIHSPPSQQRCCTPAAVWPLSRMQLWIFTPQRDNEVSSGAKNEPVVLPRESWGLSLLSEPTLCRAKDIHLLLIGYMELTWQFTASGKRVVITICWKVSYIGISKQTDGEQECYRISEWRLQNWLRAN